jgi:hypothetical protein
MVFANVVNSAFDAARPTGIGLISLPIGFWVVFVWNRMAISVLWTAKRIVPTGFSDCNSRAALLSLGPLAF